MRREWILLTALFAATLWGGAVHADGDSTPTPSTPPAPNTPAAQGELPLALSIRALSLSQPSFTDTGDLDRVKPLNGSGTSRWPSASTPVARGVYISVSPLCVPGVDEPFFPGPPRSSAARRR
jgi:hypothetical protein